MKKIHKSILFHIGAILISPLWFVGGILLVIVVLPLWLPMMILVGLHDMGIECMWWLDSNEKDDLKVNP